MSAAFEHKKETVDSLHNELAQAQCVITANYSGLSVSEMQALRTNATEANVRLKVYKNTLVRRALEGTPFAGLTQHMSGQLILGYTPEDPATLAKVLHDFSKEHEPLELAFGALPEKLMQPTQIKDLARLPAREVLLAQLAGTLLAPITAFARTLAEIPAKFVRSIATVRDSRDS